MKKQFKLFLIILAFSLLCFSGCLFTDKSEHIKRTNPKPTEEIDSVIVLSSNGILPDWKIIAKKVDRFPEKRTWIGYQVHFETLNNNEKSIIICDIAEIDELSNILKGKGHVVLTSPKGLLKTELIIYNRFTNAIDAPGYVYLKRGSNIMEGYGLVTNVGFDFINLKQVTGHGSPKKEDFN